MREKYPKSPLVKYKIKKESNCIRKYLSLVVLGEVKGLSIYKDDICIHIGGKQEQSIYSPKLFCPLNLCLPNPSQPCQLGIFGPVVIPL